MCVRLAAKCAQVKPSKLTLGPYVACRTGAHVARGLHASARATVDAWVRVTVGDLNGTCPAAKSRGTQTSVRPGVVDTSGAIRTGRRQTVVEIHGARGSTIARGTCARKRSHKVGACTAIAARERQTFVDIRLAKNAGVSRGTLTRKMAQLVETHSAVGAWR